MLCYAMPTPYRYDMVYQVARISTPAPLTLRRKKTQTAGGAQREPSNYLCCYLLVSKTNPPNARKTRWPRATRRPRSTQSPHPTIKNMSHSYMRYRMLRDVRYSTVLHGNDSRLKSQDNFREKAGSFSYTSENKKSNNSQSAPIFYSMAKKKARMVWRSNLGVVSARGVDGLSHDVEVVFRQHGWRVVDALSGPVEGCAAVST